MMIRLKKDFDSHAYAFIIIGILLFLASFELLSGIYPVATIILQLFIITAPGLLLLKVLRMECNSITKFIYASGMGLVVVVLVTFCSNLLYINNVIDIKPISKIGFYLTYTLTISALAILANTYGAPLKKPNIPVSGTSIKIGIILAALFTSLIIGAITLATANQSTLVQAFIILITAFVLVVGFTSNRIYASIILYFASLGLLWQTSLVGINPAGDLLSEYKFAYSVLNSGYWLPSTPAASKTGMLRITLLHPIFTIVGNMPAPYEIELASEKLYWQMVITHPLILSVLPVALFEITRKIFSFHISYYSSLLLISLHPYFTILSRNSRTGTALLFLLILVLSFADEELNVKQRSVISMLSMTGIVVSHYAVAPIVVSLLALVFILDYYGFDGPTIDLGFLAIAVVISGSWYMYTSESHILLMLFHIIIESTTNIFAPTSAASHAIRHSDPSFTYRFIKISTILMILFSILGVLSSYNILSAVRYGFERVMSSPSNTRFLSILGFGMLSLLLGSFFISSLGIGRVLIIAFTILAPFSVYGVYKMLQLSETYLMREQNLSANYSFVRVLAVILAIFFLVNTGIIGTQLNENTPQPNLDRTDILKSNDDLLVYELYNNYIPNQDIISARWILTHSDGSLIFGSRNDMPRKRYFHGKDVQNPYQPLSVETVDPSRGYTYLSTKAKSISAIVYLPDTTGRSYQFVCLEPLSNTGLPSKGIIYTNGNSDILFNENHRGALGQNHVELGCT